MNRIFFYFIAFNLFISCNNIKEARYFNSKKLPVYNMANEQIDILKKGSYFKIVNTASNLAKIDNIYDVYLKIDEGKWIGSRYVFLKDSPEILNDYMGLYMPPYYVEAINEDNKEIIYKYQEKNKEEYSSRYFWHFFTPTALYITGAIIYYQYNDIWYSCIVSKVKKINKNFIEIYGIYKHPDIFEEIESVKFELKLEGSKLYIKSTSSWKYLEEEFVKVNDATFDKLREITAFEEE